MILLVKYSKYNENMHIKIFGTPYFRQAIDLKIWTSTKNLYH